jgi:predicted ATP-grasp superfamily ATP-dependent carboligase
VNKKNILITGAGSGGTNCLLSTLNTREEYVFIGCNANKHRVVCSNTDYTYLVPEARDTENYVESINKICKKHSVDLVVPNSDIEVEVLSIHQDNLHASLFLPDTKTILLSQDKMVMHDFCQKNGVPVAKAVAFQNLEDISKIDTVFDSYPLWCRIKSGAGSKFTSKIYSASHARQYIEHIITANDVSLDEFIISELLPGNDYLVMTTWRGGSLVQCKMAHRMSYFGKQGESPPYLIKSFFDDEVFEFAVNTSKIFSPKPNGNFNFDLKLDVNGKIHLTEINPGRFYYNMSLFNSTSGFNSFNVFLKAAFGNLNELSLPLIGKEEKFFIRDQDNSPSVLSPEEFQRINYI